MVFERRSSRAVGPHHGASFMSWNYGHHHHRHDPSGSAPTPPDQQGPGVPTQPGSDGSEQASNTFVTLLLPENNSGAAGVARVTLDGNTLTVDVVASGLTPGEPHPMHIHGFLDGEP